MFLLFIIFICTVTALSPVILRRLGRSTDGTSSFLPYLAAVLFLIAFFIPDIHISTETNTFQQHFVGGGFYSACLYVYFRQVFKWSFAWPLELALLFAWTSAFGVANELLEFILVKLNISSIDLTDADWDLMANSVGALTGYAILMMFKKVRSK
jgi:hypothetical protein